ncbi:MULTISPECIES: hypothetical protein [unclassified Streptomyces]|uniref:hypothetical protein n=1 Tax=unclassified Streptomyces TaxID=2593676 RepID=UPI002E3554A4|nr:MULTISPECIES: hypothetical protein [unclassified Streptomyces]WUC63280.1 hypothetical protein OG861_03090 [Streptomyces sp. NBC_00539]
MAASRTAYAKRAARPHGAAPAALVGVALLATGLLSGCGTPGVRQDDARAAVTGFEKALAAKDFAGVCSRLAPQTREEVEDSEGKGCADAVPGLSLPGVGSPVRVTVYGRQAQVVGPGDTLFLSQFDHGWKVVAAGCEPRQGQPYKCTVKGG